MKPNSERRKSKSNIIKNKIKANRQCIKCINKNSTVFRYTEIKARINDLKFLNKSQSGITTIKVPSPISPHSVLLLKGNHLNFLCLSLGQYYIIPL